MQLRPVTLTEARRFVGQHHRHNKPPVGWLFGVGLSNGDGELIGVAIAGRPVSRRLDDGQTVEITRVCTLGDRNANSMLYGAICRVAKALGYKQAFTYTLAEESGVSIQAAGFTQDREIPESSTRWNCNARHRLETDLFGHELKPTGAKRRWVRQLNTKRLLR